MSVPDRPASGSIGSGFLVQPKCSASLPNAWPIPRRSSERGSPNLRPSIAREVSNMVEKTDVQVNAARTAAKARQAIAERIGKLAPSVEKDADAQVVLHLAESCANLAAEPVGHRNPIRARTGDLVPSPAMF